MMHTIKNKIETTTHAISDLSLNLRSLTKYCWMTAGAFFILYIYLIGAITFSVIRQESLAHAIRGVVSETSREELQYLTLQKNLTVGYATERGFVTAPTISYATATRNFAWNIKQ